MMYGGMVWGASLGTVLLLGFAYIIWVVSAKEKGTIKTVGQVIAVIIAVLALWILLYGGIYRGMIGGAGCGENDKGHKMMGQGMMDKGMTGKHMVE